MFNPDKEPQKTNLEKIEFTEQEKEIIKTAQKEGIESQKFLDLIKSWTEIWQKGVEKEKGNEFNVAQIKFLRRRMYLYINMELFEEAHEDLNDVLELARQTQNEELIKLLVIDLKLYSDRN